MGITPLHTIIAIKESHAPLSYTYICLFCIFIINRLDMTVGCQPGIQIYRIVTSSNRMILSIYAVSATFKCLCTQSPLLQNTQQSQRKSSFSASRYRRCYQ